MWASGVPGAERTTLSNVVSQIVGLRLVEHGVAPGNEILQQPRLGERVLRRAGEHHLGVANLDQDLAGLTLQSHVDSHVVARPTIIRLHGALLAGRALAA